MVLVMKSPTTGKRARSSTPRVRTGCQTCRKRHIKCDETQPTCLKCTRAGWKCDGYRIHKRNLALSANNNDTARTDSLGSTLSIASYSIPFSIPRSQRDRQILHYYCAQGSYELAGYLNDEFWTRTILQGSHREPVVRQALVSLSSLHLNYVTTTTSGNGTVGGETLTQYGKALRALRKRVEKPSSEGIRSALICCIMFYCFEAALGNSDCALHHLQSGLGLLSSYRRDQRHGEVEDVDILSRVFEGLDLQTTSFDDERVPALTSTTDKDRETWISELIDPGDFATLDDAYQALVKLQNWLFHFLTKNIPYKSHARESTLAPILEEKGRLFKQLNRWRTKFDSIQYHKGESDQATCGTQTLLIHWRVSCMLLEADHPTNKTVFGASPNPQAEEVLNMASSVLGRNAKRNMMTGTARSPRRNFSSETGVVAPLFTLAMKCSDEYVCNRAAELLATSRRREGLYDAESMSTIIHQFRRARQQRMTRPEGLHVEKTENSSLERLFEQRIDGVTGGMDKIAIAPRPDDIISYYLI